MQQQFYTCSKDISFVSGKPNVENHFILFNVTYFLLELFLIVGKMASKENATGGSNSQQPQQEQQPVVVDRDKVKNEREARRLAKLASKQKVQDKSRNLPNADEKSAEVKSNTKVTNQAMSSGKSGDTIASNQNTHRKMPKHGKPDEKTVEAIANDLEKMKISNETSQPAESSGSGVVKLEKKQLSKAERRAIQEAQRAAKATKTSEKPATKPSTTKKNDAEPKAGGPSTGAKTSNENTPSTSRDASARKSMMVKKSHQHRVKLFNHLYTDKSAVDSIPTHPAIIRLGVQYSSGIVKGCNARGLAFMSAIKEVITEYETPSQKEFSRSLEDVIKKCGKYLQNSRPLAVSVVNAMKFIQFQLRQLSKTDSDAEVISLTSYEISNTPNIVLKFPNFFSTHTHSKRKRY